MEKNIVTRVLLILVIGIINLCVLCSVHAGDEIKIQFTPANDEAHVEKIEDVAVVTGAINIEWEPVDLEEEVLVYAVPEGAKPKLLTEQAVPNNGKFEYNTEEHDDGKYQIIINSWPDKTQIAESDIFIINNEPPKIRPPDEMNIEFNKPDDEPRLIELDNYLEPSEDKTAIKWEAIVSVEGIITVKIKEDAGSKVAQITPENPGETKITFTAIDTKAMPDVHDKSSIKDLITVSVNSPPRIEKDAFPSELVMDEDATETIELSKYVKDDDDDDLTWEVEDTSTEIEVNIVKNTATIEVIKRVTGQAEVRFIVSDNKASVSVNVIIYIFAKDEHLKILSPAEGTVIKSDTMEIRWVAKEESDEQNAKIVVSGESFDFEKDIQIEEGIFNLPLAVYEDGDYTLRMEVEIEGKITTFGPINFILDRMPPKLDIPLSEKDIEFKPKGEPYKIVLNNFTEDEGVIWAIADKSQMRHAILDDAQIASGVLTITPPLAIEQPEDYQEGELVVEDIFIVKAYTHEGGAEATAEFNIQTKNYPPLINGFPVGQTVTKGRFFILGLDELVEQKLVEDKDEDEITWDFEPNRSKNIIIVSIFEEGKLSVKIIANNTAEEKSEVITFTVSDGKGGKDEWQYTVFINTPPEIEKPIPSVEFDEEQEIELYLNEKVKDDDGDQITWTREGDITFDPAPNIEFEPGDKIFEINEERLRDEGVVIFSGVKNKYGAGRVTFKATDGHEDSEDTVLVEVIVKNVNDSPLQKSGVIPSTFITQGKSLTIQLANFFEDVDGDELTWELKEKTYENLDVGINQQICTIAAKEDAAGSETVEFTVSDGTVDVDFGYEVIINQIPEIKDIPPVEFSEDAEIPYVMDLSKYVDDKDGDEIYWFIKDKGEVKNTLEVAGIFKVDIEGSIVTFEGFPNQYGEAPIILRATDVIISDTGDIVEKGGADEKEVTVKVKPINDRPDIEDGTFGDEVLVNQGQSKTFEKKLSELVFDPDKDDTIEWTWEVLGDDEEKAKAEESFKLVEEDDVLSIHGLTGNYGTFVITFTAKDSEGLSDSEQMILVVNAMPVLEAFEPIKFAEQKTEELEDKFELPLDDYVIDPEDGKKVAWEAEESEHISVSINDENRIATFTSKEPEKNWHGEEKVILRAIDSSGAVSEPGEIVVEVVAVEEAPILNNELLEAGIEFEEDTTFTLSPEDWKDWVQDDDDKPEDINWQVEGSEHINVAFENKLFTFTSKEKNWHDAEEVTLTAIDSDEQSISGTLKVTVKSVSEAPILTIPITLPLEGEFIEDESGKLDKFLDYVEDDDTTKDKIEWNAISSDNITVQIDRDNEEILFIPETNWHGTDTATIIAIDGEGLEASAEIGLTFKSVPEPPVIEPFDTVLLEEDTEKTIDLLGNVTDDDDEPEDIIWSSEGSENISVNIEGSKVTFKPVHNWHGEEELTFKAEDTDGLHDETKIPIKVTSVPEVPVLKSFSVSFTEDAQKTVDLSQYVDDDDTPADELEWNVVGENEYIQVAFQVTVEGAFATFQTKEEKNNWYGDAIIRLKAVDEDNLSAEADVSVSVIAENDAPTVSDIKISEPEVSANVKIRFKIQDVEGDESRVWVFYRKNGDRMMCVLENAAPTGAVNITDDIQNPTEIPILWFSGIGELADSKHTVTLIVKSSDLHGATAEVESKPFELDNTGRFSPVLGDARLQKLPEGGKFKREVPVELNVQNTGSPIDVEVVYRTVDIQEGQYSDWMPATVREKGNPLNSGFLTQVSEGQKTFFWNSEIDATTPGKYQLRLTPVYISLPKDKKNGEQAPEDVVAIPIGKSVITSIFEVEVEAPTSKEKTLVRILPESRIITPALSDGYNDILEIRFKGNLLASLGGLQKDVNHKSAGQSYAATENKSRLQIYDISGFLVYESEKDSHIPIPNGWFLYRWNGKENNDDGGEVLKSGIYIYVLSVNGEIKKGTFAIAR